MNKLINGRKRQISLAEELHRIYIDTTPSKEVFGLHIVTSFQRAQ